MDNKKLHLEALALFQKMEARTSVVSAKRTVAHYDERRKEVTKTLRPILTEMQTKFEAGEQIAGCDSMKDYCASFKTQGCLTYARCRQIITGKSGNEGKVKSLDLKEGVVVTINGVKYTVGNISKIRGSSVFRVAATPVEEPKESPAPVKVIHARASKLLSICEAYRPNKPREKGKLFSDKRENTNCPDCKQLLAKRAAEREEWRKQDDEIEEARSKRDEPIKSRKSLCPCGKRKPRKAELCQECKNPQWATEKELKKTAPTPVKKTHVTGRKHDAERGRTRCQKEINEVTIDDVNPTCGPCQRSLQQDERIKWGDEFDALLADTTLTEKAQHAAWLDFTQAKSGYVRGKDEYEWVKIEEQAALVLKNPLHFVVPTPTPVSRVEYLAAEKPSTENACGSGEAPRQESAEKSTLTVTLKPEKVSPMILKHHEDKVGLAINGGLRTPREIAEAQNMTVDEVKAAVERLNDQCVKSTEKPLVTFGESDAAESPEIRNQ